MKKEYKPGDKVTVEAEVSLINTYGVMVKIDGFKYMVSENSIKHAEPEFIPREMICWNNHEDEASKRMVVGMFQGEFLVRRKHGTIIGYKNAKELPKELENGKVYKNKNTNSIFYKTGDNSGFGFNDCYIFSNWENDIFLHPEYWKPYPIEDFKTLLISEAKKRGFKSGVWFDCRELVTSNRFWFKYVDGDKFSWYNGNTDINLLLNDQVILKNGIWAKIIE